MDELRATYANRSELRLHLFEPLKSLAEVYYTNSQWKNAVTTLDEALGVLDKSLWPIYAVNALLLLSECQWNLGKKELAKKNSRDACECYRIQTGADKRMFKEMFVHLDSPIDF